MVESGGAIPTEVKRRQHLRILCYCLFVFAAAIYGYARLAGAETSFDWVRFGKSVEHINWNWLGLAVILSIACYYVRAVRWIELMRACESRPSAGEVFAATAIGFSAVILLGRPGEFVRPYLIARKANTSFASQIGVWVLERIFDFLVVLLLFGIGLFRVRSSGARIGEKMQWVMETGGSVVGLGAVVLLLLIVALRAFSGHPKENLERWAMYLPERLQRGTHRLLVEFADGVEATRDTRTLSLILGYTVVEWGTIIGGYYALLRALQTLPRFSFTDVLILLGFTALGSLIQIPGVGGGMQVVTVMVLSELFRVPLETASGVALVIWLVTYVMILPLGLWYALREGITWKNLKNMGKLEELDVAS